MFRAVLASGFLAFLGFVAPAQAQSQHYQPGFPLVYYHPVPDVSSGGIYGYGHRGYGMRHARWDDGCRCVPAHARHAWRAYGHHPQGYHRRRAFRPDIYVETELVRRPRRPMVQSYAEVDRPYGYAYRPRPKPRNTYSSAYREDAGSWRTRRDGIVIVHPRAPAARPVLRSDDALVTPGRSGAVVVTGPRHRHAPQANGPVNVVRPKPEGQRIRQVRTD
ncbi:hypothetical protein [Rhabdaerophilum sp. SD176]|uniref:hypothetical protein n=1 Tax=Rhabdaerophilum sp. SD176 TaxID=2983548 RepID=UPI0024DF3DED|nr:hypothetical protein [Rhabdaerophilum sp. SD176]